MINLNPLPQQIYQLPMQMILEVTRSCNQACPFCSCPWFAPEAGELLPEIEIEEFCRMAAEFIAHGVRYISISGGEPTLKVGVEKLIVQVAESLQKFYGREQHLAFFTNCKNMTPEFLSLLAEHQVELYTSLPGLSSFAAQTGETAADFRRVLKWIHLARQQGIGVSVGVTIDRKMLHELFETLSYAILSGANQVILNLFKPSGRGLAQKNLALTPQESEQVAQIADQVVELCGNACRLGGEFPPEVKIAAHPQLVVENHCQACKRSLVVGPEGWLRSCEHDPVRLLPWRKWRNLPQLERYRQFMTRKDLAVCPLLD
ncbi:MAG: radical SAM protein [Victivallaceae bacterium]